MKVSDVMQKNVDFVDNDTSVREVARIIFGRSINGVPVCKNKKVVGFITERDIIAKFYPTMEEYVNDPFHSSDFEGMEKRVSEILEIKAKEIMTKNPIVVSPDTPLLKAQSLMFLEKIGRLPVVDGKGNLIGIIAKGDIFRSVVGTSLSLQEEEGFYDWSAKLYDTMIDWKERLAFEIPDMESLFKKQGVRRILDVASSTGEHSIALASRGFEVFGVESSSLMSKTARSKKNKSSRDIQSKMNLFQGEYKETIKRIKEPVDAAIFMGNALPHVEHTDKNILKYVVNALRPKNAIIIFQIINFNRILQNKNGLVDFAKRNGKTGSYYKSHIFLNFYTKKGNNTVSSRAILSSVDDKKWSCVTINSTPIKEITKVELEKTLKELGFLQISFYGSSSSNGSLFKEPFNELESDWLTVVAKR